MSDPGPTPTVIFDWSDREGSSWWLAAFIFLSFLLHSLAFFVFQGKTPPPHRGMRTAPAVQILSASDPASLSPEATALLQWIATQDPALVAKTQTVQPGGLTDIVYRPSFQIMRTQPLAAPPEPPTIQFPAARDPVALIRSLSRTKAAIAPALPAQPTQITFSHALDERRSPTLSLIPQAKADTTVQPSVLLVGVSAQGETRFTFLQQSSGSPALDSEAAAFIRSSRFGAGEEDLVWGTVTFAWGDDALVRPDSPK
jgi:outer membrane biosynthesis protein TonB